MNLTIWRLIGPPSQRRNVLILLWLRCIVAGSMALLLWSCTGEKGFDPPLDEGELKVLVGQASFVFKGEILETGASTVTGIANLNRATIVRVENILKAPKVLKDKEGRRVTVLSDEGRVLRQGGHYVFFARLAILGLGIAVREIRAVPEVQVSAKLHDLLVAEIRERPDRILQDYLTQADLIVSGRVTAVLPADQVNRPQFISEHYPNWQRATVKVEKVERGAFASSLLTVFFPASRDVMWFAAPKFRVGQEATWLLTAVSGSTLPVASFVASNPSDVRPPAERPRLRRLIERMKEVSK